MTPSLSTIQRFAEQHPRLAEAMLGMLRDPGYAARVRRGEAEIFDDPDFPLVLLSGAVRADDAQEGAAMYLRQGGTHSPIVCDLAQAFWSEKVSMTLLANVLDQASRQGGVGSVAHRQRVLVCCLLARFAMAHEPGPWEAPIEATLPLLERWARGDASVDPRALQADSDALWRTSNSHAVDACTAAVDAAAAPDGASVASAAISASSAWLEVERTRRNSDAMVAAFLRFTLPVFPPCAHAHG